MGYSYSYVVVGLNAQGSLCDSGHTCIGTLGLWEIKILPVGSFCGKYFGFSLSVTALMKPSWPRDAYSVDTSANQHVSSPSYEVGGIGIYNNSIGPR